MPDELTIETPMSPGEIVDAVLVDAAQREPRLTGWFASVSTPGSTPLDLTSPPWAPEAWPDAAAPWVWPSPPPLHTWHDISLRQGDSFGITTTFLVGDDCDQFATARAPWLERARWAVHNLVAHPLLVLCPPLGRRLHDATVPRESDPAAFLWAAD